MSSTRALANVFAAPSIAAVILAAGCGQREPAGGQQQATTQNQTEAAAQSESAAFPRPPFVGQAWLSVTRGHAPGSLRIFMEDGTLLMDSCTGTYRLAPWGMVAPDRIRWTEATVPIEAQFEQTRPNTLTLRIVGVAEEQYYIRASAPYVCPSPQ
ncbi:MAG TPA: hypothetical protein VK025_10740 [Steroidobacter sp.]|jgi:hypothetical protein|nr:hypothetical protein [Steroidobacteraceae bacterium]HLS81870.1 hypothetical protein [Steroidobacter sp.]